MFVYLEFKAEKGFLAPFSAFVYPFSVWGFFSSKSSILLMQNLNCMHYPTALYEIVINGQFG